MNTENTSTAVAEPTLASVRAERIAAEEKVAEASRVADKKSALSRLDDFTVYLGGEIERLDAERKRLAERRKVLEAALAVAKSIDTEVVIDAKEIREVTKKAETVYYDRKVTELASRATLAINDGMIRLADPRFRDDMIYFHPARRFHEGGMIR
jgi:hypothetical protein